MLAPYVKWKPFQKIVPQMSLFRRHIFSKCSRIRNEFFVIRYHFLLIIHHCTCIQVPRSPFSLRIRLFAYDNECVFSFKFIYNIQPHI